MDNVIQSLILDAEYNSCRDWILKARDRNITWNDIKYACKNNETGLESFLATMEELFFWTITTEQWYLLVNKMKEVEESGKPGFIGDPKKTLKSIPTDEGSCWMNYRKKLELKKFTYLSISNIEKSSQKIISQLELATEQTNPVRGMVVGNVQSGKTANMAGVISMAADYGFNFFIVLTGTIDNLRKQTRERLISDLSSNHCSLDIINLDNLSSKTIYPYRLQDLYLNNSHKRYLTVCLKNSNRLKELLNWLNKDQKAKANLKILLIDDEADQAGINTKNIDTTEQTAIPRLIKNLVFGKNSKDITCGNYMSMNYIGYTATPYANLLNETGNETLYPKNFISTLNISTEYFGPQQIFGIDGINEPLNISNTILQSEINYINEDISLVEGKLPNSMKDSILWFSITVAIFRFWKLKKPVSMLIHTSQVTERHINVAEGISNFFKNKKYIDLEKELLRVYDEQVNMLSLEYFKEVMVDYDDIDVIKNYPSFEEIKEELQKLIDSGLTNINLGDENQLIFNNGIHLCIDNCKSNSIDNSIEMRIVYPDDKDSINDISPAFIVIGGATLSRGLTLKGLTTSYFLRSTNQADTLMQMGRWFGYRPKYELLPRLWLSKDSYSRFNRLTKLDYDLRKELEMMELKGLSPKDYGPRLDSFPDYKLLVLTAKNKRQSAIECKTTFYNKTAQTTWFYRDETIIDSNYKNTVNFLNELGNLDVERINKLNNPYCNSNTLMWFDVDYNKVIDYLGSLQIPNQNATFSEITKLKEWYDKEYNKGEMNNWTIIAGGVENKINNTVKLNNGLVINLENRSRIERIGPAAKDYSQFIDLNTISQSNDRLMDIDCSMFDDKMLEDLTGNTLKFLDKRIKYASNNTPLLIVYIVDKDSGKNGVRNFEGNGYKRYSLSSLNLSNHLVGYYIYIPYGNDKQNEGYVSVILNYDEEEQEVDINEN